MADPQAPNIFEQLANQEATVKQPVTSEKQSVQTSGNIFEQLAANNGTLPETVVPEKNAMTGKVQAPNPTTKPGSTPPEISTGSKFDMGKAQESGHYYQTSENGKQMEYLLQKPGESYIDFRNRVTAYGKGVSQGDVNAESNQPIKAATTLAVAGAPAALGYAAEATPVAKAIIEHLSQPGAIFKFPYGRAIEYYMAAKMGLSQSHISEVAKYLPK